MNARAWVWSLLLAPLAGCSGDKNFWLPQNNLLSMVGPDDRVASMVALDDRVAFVETNAHIAYLLDPADPSLTPRPVPVGKAPVLAVKRHGANQLLVLTKGDRGSSDHDAIPAELDVIDGVAPAAPAPAVTPYALEGRYDALAQSDDGRFLALYHSPAGQSQGDTAIFNPNEMTLVDFTAAVPAKSKTIRSLGGTPSAIRFSPPYVLSGPHTLGVVLSQNYVTILDLENRDNTEISVPLCPQSAGCSLEPVDVIFDPSNPTTDAPYISLYVRVSGARDIYQITLTDIGPATPPSNPFSASLSMLAVGSTASDMAIYGSGKVDTRLVVAAAQAKSLVIIDPRTSHATTIPTMIPVSRIVPFTLPPIPPSTLDRPQALLVDTSSGSTSVLFADLQQVETTGGLSLTDYSLGAATGKVHPLVDQGIVVLESGRFSGSAALTVVDLGTRSFSAFDTGTVLSTFETRAPSRLWSADSSTGLSTGLCYLNLVPRSSTIARLTTGETWLDQAIVSIMPLARSSAERTNDLTRYLVVGHSDPYGIGNLTILDAETPDRAKARTAYGFLLSNYLEREQP
jgi:hypothetical protein